MGQHRQHLVIGGKLHQINNASQGNKYFILALGLVVPFLVLFCIFPSGSGYNRNAIVVSHRHVPSLRALSAGHDMLSSDEIYHRKTETKLSASSIDEPALASKSARRQNDGLLLSKKSKKQNDGTSSIDSSSQKRLNHAPTVSTLLDKKLHKQTSAEEIETKKSSRKGKIQYNTDEISDTAVDDNFSFSGKGDANEADETWLKPDKEEEEISSLGKEISANEEDVPVSPRSSSSKQFITRKDIDMSFMESADSAADEEEGVSVLGKEKPSKPRLRKERFTKSGKRGYNPYYAIEEKIGTNHGADLLYLENADKEMFVIEPSIKEIQKKSFSVENIGEDDQQQSQEDANHGEEDDSMSYNTSHVSPQPLPSNTTKPSDKERIVIESNYTNKSKKRGQSLNVENVGEDDHQQDSHIRGREDRSNGIANKYMKPLPFNTKQSDKCRYYKGRWIIDSKDPLYMDSTCSWISINDQQNCKVTSKSTKPIRWRWQPSDCKMERFKIKSFLKLMQRKSLAFVGDKLAKAQMQSLVCLLAQVEKPSLVYDDNNNKSMSWHFSSSNFTISMVWSPYLVQEDKENGYKTLLLDKLDTKWAVMVPTLDVLVLGVGSLFIEPTIYMVRDRVAGCYACRDINNKNNITELSMYSGFRATMRSAIMGIGALPGFEGITLFLQPFGFEGNGSYHSVSMKMKEIQEEEIYEAHTRGSIPNQSKMGVLYTNLVSMSKYDPMQGSKHPTCLVHSPLTKTWNQFLQHTLIGLLNQSSYNQPNIFLR